MNGPSHRVDLEDIHAYVILQIVGSVTIEAGGDGGRRGGDALPVRHGGITAVHIPTVMAARFP